MLERSEARIQKHEEQIKNECFLSWQMKIGEPDGALDYIQNLRDLRRRVNLLRQGIIELREPIGKARKYAANYKKIDAADRSTW